MKGFNRAKGYSYDSKWEETLVSGTMKDFKYHPEIIKYTVPASEHKYSPDWILTSLELMSDCWTIYIEAKGRFRSREEMNKYIHIKASLKGNEELVFLFQKPKVHVFGAAKRKDGTRMSHAEWAEKNKFRWFDESNIQQLLGK